MNLEQFDKLPIETKKNLLIHWWHYYGKTLYSLAELEKFMELLSTDFEKVLQLAVILYMQKEGSTIVILAIRNNSISQLIANLPDLSTISAEALVYYNTFKEMFIEEITETSKINFDLEGNARK